MADRPQTPFTRWVVDQRQPEPTWDELEARVDQLEQKLREVLETLPKPDEAA